MAITGQKLDFELARDLARLLAASANPETMLIAWADRLRDRHSPGCVKCQIGERPGWEVYGENHGGRLKVVVNQGDYVFIYS